MKSSRGGWFEARFPYSDQRARFKIAFLDTTVSARYSTFKKRLAGDCTSRVEAILMLAEMKSRLSEAIATISQHYQHNPISFAEHAAFRRGLSCDNWRPFESLLLRLGEKVHPRLVGMLHDPFLAPRVLNVLLQSGGHDGVRSALGHAPHLVPQLLSGDVEWRRIAIEGLAEGLARRSQADEDGPGGVLSYLVDYARDLQKHPEETELQATLLKAIQDYRPGLFPEIAAWWQLADALDSCDRTSAAYARKRGESAYRDLLKSFKQRPLELPVHYIRDLALCADARALALLKALAESNVSKGTWDDNDGKAEPRWVVPYPGAEELLERLSLGGAPSTQPQAGGKFTKSRRKKPPKSGRKQSAKPRGRR